MPDNFKTPNFKVNWTQAKEIFQEKSPILAPFPHGDSKKAVFPLETDLSKLSYEEMLNRVIKGAEQAMGGIGYARHSKESCF